MKGLVKHMPTNFGPTQNPALVNKIPFIPKIALPTVFGEALSYIEELGRVVKACNQVIQQSNETVQTVAEYTELVLQLQRSIDGLNDTLSAMQVLTSYKPIIYIGNETFPLGDADLDLTPSDDMYTHDWSDTFILSDALVNGEPAFPFTDGTIVIDSATGYIGKCYINKGSSLCGITGLGVQLSASELGDLRFYADGRALVYKGANRFPAPGEFMSFGLSNPLEAHDWHDEFILPSGITGTPFRDGAPVVDSHYGGIGVLVWGYDESFNFRCGITGVSYNTPVFKSTGSDEAIVETTLTRGTDGYVIAMNGRSSDVPHTFTPILSGIANPSVANDAANKAYVDRLAPVSVNVVIDEDNSVGTMDKTFNEIATAISNGRLVPVKDSRCTLTEGSMSFVVSYSIHPTTNVCTVVVHDTGIPGAVTTFTCASPTAYPFAQYT